MKKREKQLLILVITIAVLGGAFIGWDFFSKKRDLLRAERGRLETELIRVDALLEEKEMWESRNTWLTANLPTYESIGQIDQAVFQVAEAKDIDGVSSKPSSPLPNVQTDYYTQAGIALRVEGKHEDIFRWLYDLKRPDQFYVVRNLKVTPHKKDSEKIVCQFELLRWYAPKTQKQKVIAPRETR